MVFAANVLILVKSDSPTCSAVACALVAVSRKTLPHLDHKAVCPCFLLSVRAWALTFGSVGHRVKSCMCVCPFACVCPVAPTLLVGKDCLIELSWHPVKSR